jgi:hypothetical protein
VNGAPAGTLTSTQCPLRTCVFTNVSLSPGRNVVTARGVRDGAASSDEVAWTLADAADVNIAAGQIATGFKSSRGARYGSDNFFTGGVGRKVYERSYGSRGDTTPIKGVEAPADQQLYETYRTGRFRYDIPLANGSYRVTLGFVEPLAATTVGERVFDVLANGRKVIADLDVLREAGAYRTVLTRSLSVVVSNRRLELGFEPTRGEAVVSNLSLCEAVDLLSTEPVLDVAAGDGNASLAAARRFAHVTSTDYVPELLERGRRRAEAERVDLQFQEADAEQLPFADASFDVVLSTFGVMFAPNQDRAAAEMMRVTKPGGRIGLASWTAEGFIGKLFDTVRAFVPPPPGLRPPTAWGSEPRLVELSARERRPSARGG